VEFGGGGISQYVHCDQNLTTFGNITEIDDVNPFGETRVENKGKKFP
jgi:hypothetical protein